MAERASWHIRPAREDDAEALTDCIRAAYAPYAGRIADLPPVDAGIAEDIADNAVWVAETGGKLVGGVVLILAPPPPILANLAVHPGAGGAGLGRALIATAEAAARRLGAAEIHLLTHAGLQEVRALYRRLGWQETLQAGNRVRMSKRLDPA